MCVFTTREKINMNRAKRKERERESRFSGRCFHSCRRLGWAQTRNQFSTLHSRRADVRIYTPSRLLKRRETTSSFTHTISNNYKRSIYYYNYSTHGVLQASFSPFPLEHTFLKWTNEIEWQFLGISKQANVITFFPFLPSFSPFTPKTITDWLTDMGCQSGKLLFRRKSSYSKSYACLALAPWWAQPSP